MDQHNIAAEKNENKKEESVYYMIHSSRYLDHFQFKTKHTQKSNMFVQDRISAGFKRVQELLLLGCIVPA